MNRFFILTLVITILLFSTGVFAYSTTTYLQTKGDATATPSGVHVTSGLQSVRLFADKIINYPPSNEATIRIEFLNNDFTLGELTTLSWDAYVVSGYMPHVDVLLDINDNGVYDSDTDDILVFEYAKVRAPFDNGPPYPLDQINTFGDKGIIDDSAIAWLNSGDPGPVGGANYTEATLSQWQAGQGGNVNPESFFAYRASLINGTVKVLALEIEIDGWIAYYPEHESFVDNVTLNGEIIADLEGSIPVLQGAVGGTGVDWTFIPNPNPLDFGTIIAGHSGVAVSTLTVGASDLSVQMIDVNPTTPEGVFNETNVYFSEDGISYTQASNWMTELLIPHGSYDDLYVKLTIPAGTHSGDFSGQIVYTVMEESLP